jgi:hypothetical protein
MRRTGILPSRTLKLRSRRISKCLMVTSVKNLKPNKVRHVELTAGVLYEICFWINGRQTGVYFLSYEANVNFHVKASEIKLPDNLPKNKDVRNTYKTAERLVHLGKVNSEKL